MSIFNKNKKAISSKINKILEIEKTIGSKITKILDFGNFNVVNIEIYDDALDDIENDIIESCHDLITYGRVE